ncbi:MAG: thiamine-phosphate kinase [Cryomorphaceae bacterium]|nr:thiamine-phosphate kinase [Cryomorphaceae bacterium]
MLDDKNPAFTPLSEIGEFGLIERLKNKTKRNLPSTAIGIGDDAAVLNHSDKTQTVVTTDLLVENVHFDFTYTPVKHLGYKCIAVNISDLAAMGATPTSILVSIAASNRVTLEAIEELYSGMQLACEKYNVEIVGGDTSSSLSGMVINITAIGTVEEGKAILRNGGNDTDLIVVSGDLGGAYMGLQVLEREKQVFKENPLVQPDLSEYEYLLQRQLKPEARVDILPMLNDLGVHPTTMIDISDGLSSEILHICKASNVGCRIYEEKIPIDPSVFKVCEEMKINAVTAAMNGGEDYELLMTIPVTDFEKIKGNPHLTVIGHLTGKDLTPYLVTNTGEVLVIKAQGWNTYK